MSSPLHHLIIDTDVGSDDACAIAFALADPERIKVCAISTSFGNVSTKQSILNVYSLLQMYGKQDIPILPGATQPLAYVYSAQWSGHGIRGMGQWENPEEDVHDAVCYYRDVQNFQLKKNNLEMKKLLEDLSNNHCGKDCPECLEIKKDFDPLLDDFEPLPALPMLFTPTDYTTEEELQDKMASFTEKEQMAHKKHAKLLVARTKARSHRSHGPHPYQHNAPLTLESKLVGFDVELKEEYDDDAIALYNKALERGHILTTSVNDYIGVRGPIQPRERRDWIGEGDEIVVKAEAVDIDTNNDTTHTTNTSSNTTQITTLSPNTLQKNNLQKNNDTAQTVPSRDLSSTEYIAAHHLVDMVSRHPHHYDLLCLGPLTNVALALEIDPLFLTKLKAFVWLGGGFVGNSTKFAEFNAYSDSMAAKIVFDELARVGSVPSDAWGGSQPQNQQNYQGEQPNQQNEQNDEQNQPKNEQPDPDLPQQHKLRALAVSWDACLSCTYDIDEYKSMFNKSDRFSWTQLTQNFKKYRKSLGFDENNRFVGNKNVALQENNDNNITNPTSCQDTCTTASLSQDLNNTPQSIHNSPQTTFTEENFQDILKYLTVYTCRQFFSYYESIIQEAVDAQSDQLSGLHTGHSNSYCESKLYKKQENGTGPKVEKKKGGQENGRQDEENQENQEKQENATPQNRQTNTPDVDNSDDNHHQLKKEEDVQPARFVICDLYALAALVYPELVESDVRSVYTFRSDVTAPENGQLVDVGKEDGRVLNSFQYVTAINKDKLTKIIRHFTCADE